MTSDQQTERTHQSRAPLAMVMVMAASMTGFILGLAIGEVVGYSEPLGLFGLFSPIVLGIIIQIHRIHKVKQ